MWGRHGGAQLEPGTPSGSGGALARSAGLGFWWESCAGNPSDDQLKQGKDASVLSSLPPPICSPSSATPSKRQTRSYSGRVMWRVPAAYDLGLDLGLWARDL